MKKKQVTLLELAKRLNLSPSTVSRALNNRHRISEKTRQAVKKLAEELEYQPNPSAKSLRESRTYAIGVLVPKIDLHFYATAISGIEETVTEAGYNIMICQSNESFEREKAVAGMLLSSRVDGLIICLSSETQEVAHLKAFPRKDIPIVFIDRFNKEVEASRVVVDDHGGALQAVSHLIEQGCRRIAHLGGPELISNSRHRLAGYKEALSRHGVPLDESLICHCNLTDDSVRRRVRKLLEMDNPPDAVFAFNDYLAYDAMKEIRANGLKVPEDVMVVGFSDEPVSSWVEPSITTVSQQAHELGKISARLILDHMESEMGGEETPPPENVVLPTRLIVRESTRREKKPA
jgi:DNA-binding LacI/PurR family transcriptional regulator